MFAIDFPKRMFFFVLFVFFFFFFFFFFVFCFLFVVVVFYQKCYSWLIPRWLTSCQVFQPMPDMSRFRHASQSRIPLTPVLWRHEVHLSVSLIISGQTQSNPNCCIIAIVVVPYWCCKTSPRTSPYINKVLLFYIFWPFYVQMQCALHVSVISFSGKPEVHPIISLW